MAGFFNEMYADGAGKVRPHYREFDQWLSQQAADIVERKRVEADLVFRRVGITFAVYGSEAGTERLIPFDINPRIIPAAEWAMLHKGLKQRVQALNLFIRTLPASTSCVPAKASSTCSRTTCACRPACPTCWKTAR